MTANTRLMVREIEAHLETIRVAAAGNARAELTELYLLALEREELATIGYGGDEVQERVRRLEAPEDIRATIRHALRWAARDERTHAVLARGLLLQTGRTWVALRSYGADLAGLIAGWSAAVLQHTVPGQAPIARFVARLITTLGGLAGKVPESAKDTLRAQTFEEFCRFQVGAEETAAIAWERIADRLAAEGATDPAYAKLATVAARIAHDERNHVKMLGVFLEAFPVGNILAPGIDAGRLRAGLTAIDPSFVRAAERLGARHLEERGLGHGGTVFVRHHDDLARAVPDALRRELRALLLETGLLEPLRPALARGGTVAIKTTFMMTYDRRDPSPHVDLVLAEELATILRELGATDVVYLEAPNHFDGMFQHRSVAEVAAYAGFTSPRYRIVDVGTDQVPHVFERGVGQDSVSRTWRDADVRIVFAKMRTNPSWLVHLSTQNLESLGRRLEEMLWHDRSVDLPSGLMMMLDTLPPHLAILDATHHVPDGLTGILGDPTPAHPGRLYAAHDPLALDLVAARHMGVTRLPKGSALPLALDWFDDPSPHLRVEGPDTPLEDFSSPHRNDFTILLSALAYPVYVFGGDRGHFWVPKMDPAAFPTWRSETAVEGIVRPALRALFGYGIPKELS